MTRFVVDASVAVKWLVPEPHAEAAIGLLDPLIQLHAPVHWMAEVGTTLWAKAAVHGALSRQQALDRIAWLGEVDVVGHPIGPLLGKAAELAFDLHLTVYDTLYLALAKVSGIRFVTADRKLFVKAGEHPDLVGLVVWIADLPQ